MNTPAHAIVNLLLFRKEKRERHVIAIISGALLPDMPMVIFYLWERLSGVSERVIWRHDYFGPGWQAVFDAFHSFPLLILAWFAARWAGMSSLTALFASMVLHSCFDFPLHHSDAHRHFFPLTDWRFASPVSYWDPAWHGRTAGSVELIVVLAGGAWLLRTAQGTALGRGVSFILFLYLAYWGFISLVWM